MSLNLQHTVRHIRISIIYERGYLQKKTQNCFFWEGSPNILNTRDSLETLNSQEEKDNSANNIYTPREKTQRAAIKGSGFQSRFFFDPSFIGPLFAARFASISFCLSAFFSSLRFLASSPEFIELEFEFPQSSPQESVVSAVTGLSAECDFTPVLKLIVETG